jgi:site-specific DNA-methyltransferase (adenine-specific)
MEEMSDRADFFNEDCIEGCRKHITDDSVDLIITDPPYGINGDKLHKHYNRKESFVLDGYIEVPSEEYADFSSRWILEAERILKPGGSIYIVSGYTNLIDILNALRQTKLTEINHIIWKYNFGVYTKRKYISSHYHILYYVKPGGRAAFNTYSRYGADEKDQNDRSLNYGDREDVWIINREYKPGKIKNKNELPSQLLIKLIQYSSNPGDLVCDLFLGSFSTAKTAIGLNRKAMGFELSKTAFIYQMEEMKKIKPGSLLSTLRQPQDSINVNHGHPWNDEESKLLTQRYLDLMRSNITKKKAIDILSEEFGRGRWSLTKRLAQIDIGPVLKNEQSLFSNRPLDNEL